MVDRKEYEALIDLGAAVEERKAGCSRMDGELLTRETFVERILPSMAKLTHCFGVIIVLRANGQCESKGTMVLVKSPAGHFLFTARHVAEEVSAKGGFAVVRPNISDEESLQGHFSEVVRFPLASSDMAWGSERMDVAAFRAPRPLVELEYLRWFDAKRCSNAVATIRKWKGEHPLATVMMGVPNYGHFLEDGVETLSLLPMITYVSSIDGSPWDGTGRPPQMHLEVDDGLHSEQSFEDEFRHRIFESLRQKAGTDAVALGGYSGGPVVVLGSDGEFLIGIVGEGDYVFGSARAVATAWDDVLKEFEGETG